MSVAKLDVSLLNCIIVWQSFLITAVETEALIELWIKVAEVPSWASVCVC